MGPLLLLWACAAAAGAAVGFGMDPDLQIDIITELDLVNTTFGITQVSGLHNASKAFLFQDVEREIHAAPHVSEKLIQLFRNKSEFTFLATLQQKAFTSGVILSIRELEHSYFELESSGLRDEIRYHYRFNGKSRTEVFPYRLADGQWHKIAVSLSASHLLLHVDCNRIYERVIDPPETNLTPESSLWLGQRNRKHGFFKGVIQDVKVIFIPNGYITQCPNLNRTCPTCSDFLSLVQGIMDLQELLAKMTAKLNYAETRLSQLEDCHCEKTCQVNGLIYRDKDSWVEDDHCRNCTCKSGVVECRRMSCPPLECPPDALPVHVESQCCKVCKAKCIYGGKVLAEGQRVLTKSCRECRNGVLVKVTETCPPLNCSEDDHVLPENQCCSVCRGHNFCAEGHRCGENSECKNWNTKATCECKNGYLSVQGDSAYCEDIDECAAKMHYCHANTVCVNLPGSYRCDCVAGYVRVDDFSCTEHDECGSGQHNCDENAICTNTIRGHSCTCKPGYVGNGTICRAFCEEGCRYGGTCIAPNKCLCPSGFTGSHCEKDIDECAEGIIECHNHSRCVNLPGWYHCECRSGFHDNGSYSLSGESCVDIDECALKTHTCWNDSACVNLAGGFDCLCPSGPSCTGDCPHEGGFKRNGQVWTLREDRCSVCSCKDGRIFCRRTACDCRNPSADLFCCPECDTRVTSQCLDQTGHKLYRSGDNWTYSCQQCRCLEGEVDCWPLLCPSLNCEYTAISEGECCPHCVSDPCLADNITYDIRKTCPDGYGITRLSGAVWTMVGSPCTTCKCKNGNVCCSVDLECLNNN
ncbi:protein kinase C-binding protein NELL1 isoform X1 [Manacus candei]|uniref:protein kinase C-binding protein NELL1 isoform X1 n=1 Tax=Manacus candei TaxID=415023 RepID=UPI002225DFAE|nr:protein kinase C-binding protein NELL1 isoform X1 [Manacus candei]